MKSTRRSHEAAFKVQAALGAFKGDARWLSWRPNLACLPPQSRAGSRTGGHAPSLSIDFLTIRLRTTAMFLRSVSCRELRITLFAQTFKMLLQDFQILVG